MKRLLIASALAVATLTATAQSSTLPHTVGLGTPASQAASAAASPADAAKQAKVHQLFAAMHVERASEQMIRTMQGMVARAADTAPGAQAATPEQRKLMAEYEQKAMDLAIANIGWKAMEPVYEKIYLAEFTDSELDGMIAFYESPAGKALLAKLPEIGEQSMKVVQERMQTLQPQMQQITSEYVEKMKAAAPAPAPAPKTPPTGK